MIRKTGLRFHNVKEQHLSLNEVVDRMLRFIAEDPRAVYHFAIGTDCQVHSRHTKFITGLVLHRVGRAAWACYRPYVLSREFANIQEKLAYETTLSQEMASHLEDLDAIPRMEELLPSYRHQGAELQPFIDIDAGTELSLNPTALYVQERSPAWRRLAAIFPASSRTPTALPVMPIAIRSARLKL